jgi:hypothetical protein
MEKAATDIYTFENLRKRGYTYVDKTAILKELADDSRGSQFFIARPRRFGKSLAVSTLKCLFEGKRDSTAKKAIAQIQDKSYTDRFRPSGKPITLIGIAFSTKRRTVSGVKIVKNA